MTLTFFVPPGIGDFSAMYAKLCNINRDIAIRSSNDHPNRLSPFLDLLPKIKNIGYGAHNAMVPVENTLPPGTDLASLPDGDYFLSINHHLEWGGTIDNWVPGETTYHYEIESGPYVKEIADLTLNILKPDRNPLIGIYCSAYGNSRHWGFWGWEEWRDLIKRVHNLLDQQPIYLLIGAEYDLAISEVLHQWMNVVGMTSHLLLGAHHIGATIELIKQMDYLFAFPSGLGFLADVVNTPNMMWFPPNLEPMMGTFLDPVNRDSNKSLHVQFSTPEQSFLKFKEHGLNHLEERCHRTILDHQR